MTKRPLLANSKLGVWRHSRNRLPCDTYPGDGSRSPGFPDRSLTPTCSEYGWMMTSFTGNQVLEPPFTPVEREVGAARARLKWAIDAAAMPGIESVLITSPDAHQRLGALDHLRIGDADKES